MLYEHDVFAITQVYETPTVDPAPVVAVQPEKGGFDLPGWIWKTMFASYAVFFGGLAFATGRDGYAVFAIIISTLYVIMFFGTAGILNSLGKAETVHEFARGPGKLDTLTGEMGVGAVAAQILTVPILFGFFGIAVAVIRTVIF